jgi:hypothetical protein
MSDILEWDNRFLTIRADTKDITVLKATWYNKPVIQIGVSVKRDMGTVNHTLVLVNKEKITQLLDMLNMPITAFYDVFNSNPAKAQKALQDAIDLADDEIFLKSSSYTSEDRGETNWYVFAVTTDRHITVPHQLLEDKIRTRFKGFSIVREQFHYTPVWNIKIREWTQKDKDDLVHEKLAAFIIVSGGRNVKKGRIHVIPMVKIGSCDNSIRAIENIEINHTEGWERKFDQSLDQAHELVTKMRTVIRLSMDHDMDEDTIERMVKDILSGLKIRNEKIETVFLVVMDRVKTLRKEKGPVTAWDVAQTITYIGSHPDEAGVGDIVTDYAQEQLQTMGYRFAEKVTQEV